MTFQELMDAYHINEHLCNKAVYNDLLEKVKNNRVTPVIGAGLSVWAKYPLWGSLLTTTAEGTPVKKKVQDLLEQNQYEQAASKLQEFYRLNAFLRLLQGEFSPVKLNAATRPDFQELLPELFRGPFVTTNYDVSLERLLDAPFVITPENTYDEEALKNKLQAHERILVKLHGTINSPGNMILTEKRYNEAYGMDANDPDMTLPLPRTLQHIFQSDLPFFLGCGLEKDRTCTVFQKCVGTKGFALLELPEETKNNDHPLQPNLTNDTGWIPKLKERREFLGNLGLQVIWYPHGMHEAVEVLIRQLALDVGINPTPTTPGDDMEQAVLYKVTENFRGREAEVDRVVEWIKTPKKSVLLLHGVAGIGKTEICKEAYRRYKQENPSFSMPLIDVAKAETTGSFWALLADGLGISLEGLAPDKVLPRIQEAINMRCHSGAACYAYLDNFEEIWDKLCRAERKTLFDQIHALNAVGLRMLISSQVKPYFNDFVDFGETVEIQPMDSGVTAITSLPWEDFCRCDQVSLFLDILGRQPRGSEQDALRQLIGEMGGHPLAIKLTACYGRDSGSLKELLDSWSCIELEETDETDRHKSLRRSLALTWRNVRDDPAAVLRWALHAHSLDPLDAETLRELNGLQESPFSETEWQGGGRLLRRFGLIETMEDDKERMLLAVKKIFPLPGEEAETADAAALKLWVRWCAVLLEQGDDRQCPDYLSCHQKALAWLPQCFYLAEQCLDTQDYALLFFLLVKAGNFYPFDTVRALPLLTRLVEETPPEFPFRGELYLRLGILLYLTGKPDDALKAYDKAEKLYQAEQKDLGLANVLKSRGDVLLCQGKPDDALDAYDKAEKLYQAVQAPLGQANVLRSRGELLLRQGKPDDALKAYDAVEKLYQAVQDPLGQAHVLLRRGVVLLRQGKPTDALKAYDKAEKLYQAVQDQQGQANVLRARGEVLLRQGKPDDALKAYDAAEKLYQAVQNQQGQANVLRARGEVLRLTGKPDDALDAYDAAEKHYQAVQDPLGQANVLRARGDVLQDKEDWQGALTYYKQALSLYRQLQASMSICYTLAEIQLCQKQLGDEAGWMKSVDELMKLLPDQPEPVQAYCIRKLQLTFPDT